MGSFMNVLEERKTKGMTDSIGETIVVENNVLDKYEQGRKVLETLNKTPQSKPAPDFGAFAPPHRCLFQRASICGHFRK
ncbi:hypothetical protein A8C56_21365 [Niabella ginsenosidivorans]|uniref:Uncharacterized protein n=1 Tax=Niabella ginsenosidivorans TaxID=1176587 RepID=A0A1A9I805_9BACT|nr:hypothetical protein A8C56_21365 [Niabella ginsenosidivorans]